MLMIITLDDVPLSIVGQDPGPDGPPPALADRLGYLLGQAHERHRRLAAARLAPFGLAPRAFGALTVLAAEGPLTQQALGTRIGLDRTTMVALVDALEAAGHVARERRPDDRRAYALRVTTQGRRTRARATRAAAGAEDDALASLTEAERATLKRLLRRVL